jgi:hypothetical protein
MLIRRRPCKGRSMIAEPRNCAKLSPPIGGISEGAGIKAGPEAEMESRLETGRSNVATLVLFINSFQEIRRKFIR